MSAFVHPTALIESGVVIGDGTAIWDHVHIRHDSRIGKSCIIGEKTHISYDVSIGDCVKINAFVYICTGVTIEMGVMVSAGCVFTNDRYPRAANSDLSALLDSDPNGAILSTLVRSGASIGAGSIIGCDLTIGRFAMVGMGSVVTKSVPDFHLVLGNPARSVGYVCRCGKPTARFRPEFPPAQLTIRCEMCGCSYKASDGLITEESTTTYLVGTA